MDFRDIKYERRGSGAWIRIDRPDDLNAMTTLFIEEAHRALDLAAADDGVRAVVLTGAGRAFCAGANLKFIQDLPEKERTVEANRFIADASAMMDRIDAFPKPVIAAVNGIATAGGMELVLSCDIVFAAENARLGDGHANFGLFPGAGGSARLPRRIGQNRANYLFFTGELLSAAEFVAPGLVNRVVPADRLEAEVEALVATIAAKSPIGLARMKQAARAAMDLPLAAGVANEQLISQLHSTSFDRSEGVAAFTEKRQPQFQGR